MVFQMNCKNITSFFYSVTVTFNEKQCVRLQINILKTWKGALQVTSTGLLCEVRAPRSKLIYKSFSLEIHSFAKHVDSALISSGADVVLEGRQVKSWTDPKAQIIPRCWQVGRRNWYSSVIMTWKSWKRKICFHTCRYLDRKRVQKRARSSVLKILEAIRVSKRNASVDRSEKIPNPCALCSLWQLLCEPNNTGGLRCLNINSELSGLGP